MKRILLLLIMLVLCCSCVSPASAWLAGFNYEKDVNIVSTYPTTLTSYQMKFIVYNTSGSSSGQNIYTDGHITQADWDDIRFATTTDAICDIWIQEYNATAAIIWVEMPYLYTGNNQIRCYYGKPLATAVSDGDATFRFYGTFAVVPLNVDKWVGVGNYTLYNDADGNSVADIMTNATSGLSSISSLDTFSYATGYEQVIRAKMGLYPSNVIGLWQSSTYYAYYGASQEVNNSIITETRTAPGSNSQETIIGSTYANAWHIYKIKRDQSGLSCLFTIDNVIVANHTLNVPTATMPISFRSTAQNGRVIVDWAFIKKFVDPEPYVFSYGAEQVEGNPVASFDGSPRWGMTGTTVYFYDTSTGVVTAWAWDLNGDSITDATTQNANYTYNNPGLYDVTLTVTNVNGTDTQTQPDYIFISVGAPSATQNIPSILLAALILIDFMLILYVLADNERVFGPIIGGVIATILSYYIGMIFMFEWGMDAGVQFRDTGTGYFFVFVGLVMTVVTILLIVDIMYGQIKGGGGEEE